MTMKIEHRTLHMLGKYSTIELLLYDLQDFVLFKFKYARVLLRLTAPLHWPSHFIFSHEGSAGVYPRARLSMLL